MYKQAVMYTMTFPFFVSAWYNTPYSEVQSSSTLHTLELYGGVLFSVCKLLSTGWEQNKQEDFPYCAAKWKTERWTINF